MKARKVTYYTPNEVKFSGAEIEKIVRDNMDMWNLDRAAAEECCDTDILQAAERLEIISLPEGWKAEE